MLNFDNDNTFDLLVQICTRYAVSPLSSLESESFFRKLLEQYDGADDTNAITQWLELQLSNKFIFFESPPQWIQNPDWPIEQDVPLIFVGQINVSPQNSRSASHTFHDDTSFYVFVGSNSTPRVIMQQY